MADTSAHEMVEQYVKELFGHTRDADLSAYLHPDFIEDWPQSGERIRGSENQHAVRVNYPDGGPTEGGLNRLVGTEDRWVTTPNFTLLKIVGSGDVYTASGWGTYPNGDKYHVVAIMELRDGKIAHQTTFFAAPFDAAAWRKEWVEFA